MVEAGLTRAATGHPRRMREMRIAAVGLDAGTGTPVLILREVGQRRRMLPVWVGVAEAEHIEIERRGLTLPRPPTHRLIAKVLDLSGRRLDSVQVTELRDGVVHAELVIDPELRIAARVSDAVAVALHVGAPILASDAVLDQAAVPGVEVVVTPGRAPDPDAPDPDAPDPDAPDLGAPDCDTADELAAVREMRRFLNRVTPDDFS